MSNKKRQETSLIFPGNNAWELWVRKSGEMELEAVAELDADGQPERFKSSSHYAFPVRSVHAVPLWVASDDPALLPGLVDIHLEKIGLKPESGVGQPIDFQLVTKEREPTNGTLPRSLVLASVLAKTYAHPLPRQIPELFDIAPRFLVLPGNHIVIWKELGKLVLAITRENRLVYFQSMAQSTINASVMQELQCILFSLRSEGIIFQPEELVVWTDDVVTEIRDLASRLLHLEIRRAEKPDPILPSKTAPLVPKEVAIIREEKRRAVRRRNIAAGIAALYLITVGYFGFTHILKKKEVEELGRTQANMGNQVAWIPSFQKEWEENIAALNPTLFPAELLFQMTKALPARVGLDSIDYTKSRNRDDETSRILTMVGKAQNVNLGYSYLTKLKSIPELKHVEWEWLVQPQVDTRDKNRLTTFRIQGTIRSEPIIDNGEA